MVNQESIVLAKNAVRHSRAKGIDIRFHYIRELVGDKKVDQEFCSTNPMITDIFTKAFTHQTFANLQNVDLRSSVRVRGDVKHSGESGD
jgi:hypothetical protein